MSRTYNVLRFVGKLAFNRLLNIQKFLLEIADADYCGANTLHLRIRENEFNFRCGFALCGAKKNICDSQHWLFEDLHQQKETSLSNLSFSLFSLPCCLLLHYW